MGIKKESFDSFIPEVLFDYYCHQEVYLLDRQNLILDHQFAELKNLVADLVLIPVIVVVILQFDFVALSNSDKLHIRQNKHPQ